MPQGFWKFEGIPPVPGDSNDPDHPRWFEFVAFEVSMSTAKPGEQPKGRKSVWMKIEWGPSYPGLNSAFFRRQKFPSAVAEFLKRDDTGIEKAYLRYTDVEIQNVRLSPELSHSPQDAGPDTAIVEMSFASAGTSHLGTGGGPPDNCRE